MNRFLYLLMALAAGALAVCAQTAADHKRPVVDGSVESVGGRLRVSLINTDNTREFRGAAQVSIDSPDRQSEVTRFEFTLAPQESRLFPLDSQGAAGRALHLPDQGGGGNPHPSQDRPHHPRRRGGVGRRASPSAKSPRAYSSSVAAPDRRKRLDGEGAAGRRATPPIAGRRDQN